MENNFIISDYIEAALREAVYDKLEDGSYSGIIPSCTGIIAFKDTLRKCENDLRSILEDWILFRFKAET